MNEMYDDRAKDPADPNNHEVWQGNKLNISREALLKLLTRYDIAPGTRSHIRGQEQVFDSGNIKNESNEANAVDRLTTLNRFNILLV